MTVSTLRPNGTVSNTGSLFGGASAHAVLSDNSDDSSVTLEESGDSFQVDYGALTLPAGAVIKTVAIRARLAVVPGMGGPVTSRLNVSVENIGAAGPSDTLYPNWVSLTTITVLSFSELGFTEAELNAARTTFALSSTVPIRLWETYLDVIYITKPVVDSVTVGGLNQPLVSWTETLDPD